MADGLALRPQLAIMVCVDGDADKKDQMNRSDARPNAPRYESPEESEAREALRAEREAAHLGRPWDAQGADAWVVNYHADLR